MTMGEHNCACGASFRAPRQMAAHVLEMAGSAVFALLDYGLVTDACRPARVAWRTGGQT
jgi:hypothetical protein